jgi:uncharacterized membrane protein YdjX (TVP38/TMEM64 family)
MKKISLLNRDIPLHVWLRLVVLVGITLGGFAIFRFSSLGDILSGNNLMSLLTELRGVWWAPLFLIGLYIVFAVVSLPAVPLLLVGALFGPFYGTIYNVAGLFMGAICSYLVAGLLGREFIVRVTGERLRRAEHVFQRHGFWPLVQTRFLPIPFTIVNFGTALAGVRPMLFITSAITGLIPSTLIHTYFMAALIESTGRQRAILLAGYAAAFLIFNLIISVFWLKRESYRKIVTFDWLRVLLKPLIRRLDNRLRRKYRIFEFSDNPRCMFRVHVALADRPLILRDDIIPVGTRVLELHFWNEHILPVAEDGADAARAIKVFKMFRDSFKELAPHLHRDPRMADVQAVGGLIPVFFEEDNYPAEKMFARLGLHVVPFEKNLGFWGHLGKQIHSWMMAWAFNPSVLKNRKLSQIRWADCWFSVDDCMRIHAKKTKQRKSNIAHGI